MYSRKTTRVKDGKRFHSALGYRPCEFETMIGLNQNLCQEYASRIRDARAERAQNILIIISMQSLHERPL